MQDILVETLVHSQDQLPGLDVVRDNATANPPLQLQHAVFGVGDVMRVREGGRRQLVQGGLSLGKFFADMRGGALTSTNQLGLKFQQRRQCCLHHTLQGRQQLKRLGPEQQM